MDSTQDDLQKRLYAIKKKAIERNKSDSEEQKSHLSPIKDENSFFIADIFETVTYRDDLASMEYPLFALKAGDTKTRKYEHDGLNITIMPNNAGMATIHDKDFWIYGISKMFQAIFEGETISRTVHFTVYDYLKSTNRSTSGRDYERAKEALDRLKGTTIKIESENKKERITRSFGLIESWVVVEEKQGRMTRVSVTYPEWLYQSVQNKKVLSISADYFRLRKPMDRRIYEIARKHCGHQESFKINLDLLRKKSGTTQDLRRFRANIKSLATSDDLPDYVVWYDDKKDMVLFTNRDEKIQEKAEITKNKKLMRKIINKL
jgi:plasmid replication initiation protein